MLDQWRIEHHMLKARELEQCAKECSYEAGQFLSLDYNANVNALTERNAEAARLVNKSKELTAKANKHLDKVERLLAKQGHIC